MTTIPMPASLAARLGQRVYDAERDEQITISEEMLTRYHQATAHLYAGFVQIAEGLAHIRDYRLYVVDGCHSFHEWIASRAGMSRRKVFNYLRIVDYYANSRGIVHLAPAVQQLGISKLLLATTLSKQEFERFKRTGDLELDGGTCLGIDEIGEMPVREFETLIRAKSGRPVSDSGSRSSEPGAWTSRRAALQQVLHTIEEGLVHLPEEAYRTWAGELQRLSMEIARHTPSHGTDSDSSA